MNDERRLPQVSLFEPIGEDIERIDFIDAESERSDEYAIRNERTLKIKELISILTSQEGEVISRRFGLGGKERETLEEIAASFGLTRERIRQIEAKALKRLRKNPTAKLLKNLIEY